MVLLLVVISRSHLKVEKCLSWMAAVINLYQVQSPSIIQFLVSENIITENCFQCGCSFNLCCRTLFFTHSLPLRFVLWTISSSFIQLYTPYTWISSFHFYPVLQLTQRGETHKTQNDALSSASLLLKGKLLAATIIKGISIVSKSCLVVHISNHSRVH